VAFVTSLIMTSRLTGHRSKIESFKNWSGWSWDGNDQTGHKSHTPQKSLKMIFKSSFEVKKRRSFKIIPADLYFHFKVLRK